MINKGRAAIGERNGQSILTAKEVLKIRDLRSAGYTYEALGKMFRVRPTTIFHATNGGTWRHLAD
jgi:hypothetical protein